MRCNKCPGRLESNCTFNILSTKEKKGTNETKQNKAKQSNNDENDNNNVRLYDNNKNKNNNDNNNQNNIKRGNPTCRGGLQWGPVFSGYPVFSSNLSWFNPITKILLKEQKP